MPEGGRDGEPRQKGAGREKAMLEDTVIHEYLSSGWREDISSGRAGEHWTPHGREGYFNGLFFSFLFVLRNHGHQDFI